MSAKRKLAMSGVAILVVLTLVAGATMAWFTDTEKVNADFKAGILDISVSDDDASDGTELNFVNMRPMEEDTAIAEMTATLNGTQDYEGYDPDPVYVQQFAINNAGTLPVKVKLTFEEVDPAADDTIKKIVSNGNGGIRQTEETVACNNELGKWYDAAAVENAYPNGFEAGDDIYNADFYKGVSTKLHFVLFKNDAEKGWQVVNEDISLKTLLKINNANGVELDGIIPAGATAENNTYALGAYLDETAGNEYQNKEYHVNFIVNAKQVDEGATYADEA
ncbi:TasA family protein [Anaeromassilibacillus sp. D41t1_190614_C2]|uniref:TasA family protein n=1 Tax=Anaeromassilibacillus sp. D41t1_190614_C2 TaxID=2787078 RepID=UPI00189E053E|nr:TasA family protein [Anaeromassilibacillus sp. D41t1_190614_C2]